MSFATDNWEEFEKLSISILETYLPADSEISYSITHTPNRKDGGYDGLIIIASGNENIDQCKILSESKLRELFHPHSVDIPCQYRTDDNCRSCHNEYIP